MLHNVTVIVISL